MGTFSKSGADDQKGTKKVHPFWSWLVIVAALAVVAVMTYPFIASWFHRELPLPSTEETTVRVADRMEAASHEERGKLARELFQQPNPLVRLAVVEAIEDWKVLKGLHLLQSGLEDNCSVVRRRSLEVLWRLDRERGLRLLLAGLKDDDVDIRRAAISQLRFANDKRAVPAVIPLLDDPDSTVRFFALGVLRKLTGKPFFTRATDPPEKQQAVIRQWKQWWQKEQDRWAEAQRWATVQPIHPQRTDPAPPLSLKTIDGSRIDGQSLKGKWVLLHFYGTWCAPCVAEMPELVRLRQTYPESDLAMIGIAVSEMQGDRAVRERIEKFKLTYPQALATPEVISAYWVPGVPITYIIDPAGQIRYRFEGERDFETFRRMIDRMRAGSIATGSSATSVGAR
ncbi:MAG: redoxin domain-containing protein [Armatimonadota bacterium]